MPPELPLDEGSVSGDHSGSNGNIDDAQFQWIHQQLLEAERRRQLVVAFAHHSLRTMDQPPVSPFPPGDQGGDASPVVARVAAALAR